MTSSSFLRAIMRASRVLPGWLLVFLLLPENAFALKYSQLLNGFFSVKSGDAAVCIEVSGIAKDGKEGKIKETHVVGSNNDDIARYTIQGTILVGASIPRWGSNGTANFSSS